MEAARILLLNGPSSAGKSTLAKALQVEAREPFLRVSMDLFLEMQPPRYDNHPDTFFWTTQEEDGSARTSFQTGPRGAALMRGFRRSVAALAGEGWSLIVDDVAAAGDWADYKRCLAGHRLLAVMVHAPLPVLEAREQARGDRMAGLARDQWQRVHRAIDYDFAVDTSELSAQAAAKAICSEFNL